MDPLRLRWAGNKDGTERATPDGVVVGWVLDTSVGLTGQMVKTAAEYAAKVQKDRIRGMANGDDRDALIRAVRLLEAGRVKVNIAGSGDRVLFDAYKSEGPRFFGPSLN